MNILFVPSWFPSHKKPSNGIYFYEQAKALSKICDNLFIVYAKEIELKKNPFKDEGNIKFFSFPKIHYRKTFFFYSYLKYFVKKIIKKYGKIDIIHAQSFLWAGIESSKIAKKFSIPLIITEHHSRYIVGNEKPGIIKILNNATDIASKIVFVSNSLKDKFIEKILKDNFFDNNKLRKLLVIPNSVTDNFFKKSEIASNIQILNSYKKYFADNDKNFIFATVANLKKTKGLDNLIIAFSKAFFENNAKKNIKLIIGGDGPERYNIEKLILKLNLQDNVILLGQLNRVQVKYVLENSNCFVLASRFETFGIVYIEALAKGLPIIATNCGGPKDIINDECGILTEIDDIEGLENAMIWMYENYEKYDKEKIKQYAFDNFSDTAFIQKYKKLYDEIS